MTDLLRHDSDAGKKFRSIVGGVNFITPILIGYIQIDDNTVAELRTTDSVGTFKDNVSVTVVRNGKYRTDLSKLCKSYADSLNYIESLHSI